ncbi:queuosine precursor transporter [Piscirickettsia litoralis]|uniref:Queuosine precursor transporter n=1 Tax=Piscirickettsia litoralis TaxID=1891921 RepID=A0ABX2ZYX2_9GAMM|nr:queuosine precursor transporter [Piscirickettsia litoralis]ODN41713.1 hypothetical protein BGC07_00330 [Piscirickettsia litoralis]
MVTKNLLDHKYQLMILLTLMVVVSCAMAASAIVALKPVQVGIIFPFSNILFSIFTFPIIDGICEIYGKRLAYYISILGIVAQAIFVIFIELSVLAPGAPIWTNQHSYESVLSKSYTVILATVVAFLVAQFLDVYLFQWLKGKTRGKMLWLRSGISSIAGQLIDSVIFICIVFHHPQINGQ